MTRNRGSIWEGYYHCRDEPFVGYDHWLSQYAQYFAFKEDIVEVGCGYGLNSLYLLSQGHKVLSTDISLNALKKLKRNGPKIRVLKMDLSETICLKKNSFDTIIADLCIHFFDSPTTTRILQDFSGVLRQRGKLFCRLNSIDDIHHGAGQGIEVERNLYYQNGIYRRYFDEETIRYFFGQWKIVRIRKYDTMRHSISKNLYEIFCRK